MLTCSPLRWRTSDACFFLRAPVPAEDAIGACPVMFATQVTTKANHEINLKQLGLPWVDLLLIHWTPFSGCSSDVDCSAIRAQWKALEALRSANLTRSIGVSNFCQSCLECLAADPSITVVPAVNQFEYHVGMGADPIGLRSYCQSKGIVAQAYSPLGPTFNASAKDILIAGGLTTGIGKMHNKTGAQVALKWVLQRGVPIVTRSESFSNLESDLDLFSWQLSDAELAALDAATEPAAKPCLFCDH